MPFKAWVPAFAGTTKMKSRSKAALIIYCLLLPGVQQNRLHPFGGANTIT
jgi:hypothetical protein